MKCCNTYSSLIIHLFMHSLSVQAQKSILAEGAPAVARTGVTAARKRRAATPQQGCFQATDLLLQKFHLSLLGQLLDLSMPGSKHPLLRTL